jgi:hypothetical protein
MAVTSVPGPMSLAFRMSLASRGRNERPGSCRIISLTNPRSFKTLLKRPTRILAERGS